MVENQLTEYKQVWKDEYLKQICGFANSKGGKLYIGINDNGEIIGVKNSKKLLEDIPNKIYSILQILTEVNLLTQDQLEYIEINIFPSSFPVNYNGKFYYRIGTTTQQITGLALNEFLLNKTPIRWEDETVDNIRVEDLDEESFRIFKRAALNSNRMSEAELNISNTELLEKLNLIKNGKLKRSAVLLFYHNPSVLQNGSYIQIGKFGNGSEIQYQDILDGSLLYSTEKIIDLIFLKYLKAKITFSHDKRIETYPYSREALREAIYNSIAHNCYKFGTPIQIRIQDDSLTISNDCILPEGWTVDTLMESHQSKPYNPDIANVFYLAGYIEIWGRGIEKICESCEEIGADLPKYSLIGNGLRIKFKALKSALINETELDSVEIPNKLNDTNNTLIGTNNGTNVTKKSNKIPIINNHPENFKETKEDKDIIKELIIENLIKNPKTTQKSLAQDLNLSLRTIKRIMRKLQEDNLIKHTGSYRNGIWQVIVK